MMMHTIKIILVSLLMSVKLFSLSGQTTSPLSLVEATAGCGQVSNCSMNTICFDVMVTPDTTGVIIAYNIWIQYAPGINLHYLSDIACLTADGNDNNFDSQGYYRLSGVQGTTTVNENVAVKLHNICFTYTSIPAINNEIIQIGGTVFGDVYSTLTYNSPILNEPQMPAHPFTLNAENVSCILLPVIWLDFHVTKVGETAQLDWTTSEEINNRGFDIMHSVNGQNYEKIGWVDAATPSAAVNTYQFIDPNPKRGINYYRLNQYDWDGKFDFSPVRTVIFNESYFSVLVTPNPAKEFLYVEIHTREDFSDIKLIDITGRIVLTANVPGTDLITNLSIDKLSPGTYTLVVESGVEIFTERLVIMN